MSGNETVAGLTSAELLADGSLGAERLVADDHAESARGSASRQWWIIACLTILSTLALLDKTIINLLVLPIQKSLGFSKTEIGLVIGTAFAIGNVGAGIPAGWMADRLHRKSIIGASVVLWSAMAASCGYAAGFTAFFISRLGVGAAEGTVPPASYSLIHDGVSRQRRGLAFSVYSMSTLIGTGLALVLGGLLVGFIAHHDFSGVPLLAGHAVWSTALIICGLIGLPITLLLLTFREPARGGANQSDTTRFADAMRVFGLNRRIFIPLAVYSVTQAMLAQSLQAWNAALVATRFHYAPAQVGQTLGLLVITAGPIGLIITGWGMDWLTRRGLAGPAILAVAMSVLLLVVVPLEPLIAQARWFWSIQSFVLVGINAYLAVTATIVSNRAPGLLIGKVITIFLVLQNIIGAGLAPAIVGFVAETAFSKTSLPLAYGMSSVHSVLAVISLGAALLLFRRCTNDAQARRLES